MNRYRLNTSLAKNSYKADLLGDSSEIQKKSKDGQTHTSHQTCSTYPHD